MKTVQITEEQAKQMHASGIESLKSVAEINFPKLFNTEKKWEDFGYIEGYYISDHSEIKYWHNYTLSGNRNLYPTKKEAEMALAMCQLLQWRDKANGEPIDEWCDWGKSDIDKHCVVRNINSIITICIINCYYPLSFKTEEIAKQFLKDHKTLIVKAFGL